MELIFTPVSNGLYVAFEDKNRRYWSFFNCPPTSLNHVDLSYLQGRFPNVRDKRHVNFIKKEWLKLIGQSTFKYSGLQIGDKVVMHSCIEAVDREDKLWTVKSHPWTLSGKEVVLLEGFSGGFATKYLTVVEGEA